MIARDRNVVAVIRGNKSSAIRHQLEKHFVNRVFQPSEIFALLRTCPKARANRSVPKALFWLNADGWLLSAPM